MAHSDDPHQPIIRSSSCTSRNRQVRHFQLCRGLSLALSVLLNVSCLNCHLPVHLFTCVDFLSTRAPVHPYVHSPALSILQLDQSFSSALPCSLMAAVTATVPLPKTPAWFLSCHHSLLYSSPCCLSLRLTPSKVGYPESCCQSHHCTLWVCYLTNSKHFHPCFSHSTPMTL